MSLPSENSNQLVNLDIQFLYLLCCSLCEMSCNEDGDGYDNAEDNLHIDPPFKFSDLPNDLRISGRPKPGPS